MELKKIKFSHQIFFKWEKTYFAILGGRPINLLSIIIPLFQEGKPNNLSIHPSSLGPSKTKD